MPRLFTALEIPPAVADSLSAIRGGLPGARWIDPADYHVTLRFMGDVDRVTADDLYEGLAQRAPRTPFAVTIDALSAFGGDRPRALVARVVPTPGLSALQAEGERIARAAGLPPETRKYTPHVTLARLRRHSPGEIAAFLAMQGQVRPLVFMAERFGLFSARDSVGGGPYVLEAAFPLQIARISPLLRISPLSLSDC
jgi:2'-5' RNA ligase